MTHQFFQLIQGNQWVQSHQYYRNSQWIPMIQCILVVQLLLSLLYYRCHLGSQDCQLGLVDQLHLRIGHKHTLNSYNAHTQSERETER